MDTTAQQPSSSSEESTPVLIVGGSLIGLSTALFLARQGIVPIVVEHHPGTAIHPRLAGVTARTMEILRAAGAEAAIRQVEPPASTDSNVPLVESLVGEQVDNLMEDFSVFFSPASPVQGSFIAQDVLEPVLRAQAEQAGAVLRYGTDLVAFEQDAEGVTATIRDRSNGSTGTVRAQYLVAADGAKSGVRQHLGVGRHGAGSIYHAISIIFEADLMELFRRRHAVMCFVANDMVNGGFVPYPGSSARPDLFRLDTSYDPEVETLDDYPEARCIELARSAAGIPDLAVRIKTVLPYEAVQLVSDRFQDGRVFLVGDAARVQPPSGGLGGNTGIAEAQNLAWKLAAVLRGEGDHRLLASYDVERRPLADYTSEQAALLSQERAAEGSAGITVNTLILSMGYRYSAGAFVLENGAEALPLAQDPAWWTGQPGTRAPHLVLERQGRSLSTLDLFGSRFVVLAGPDGKPWLEAARRARAALHLPLDSYQVGGEAGDLVDPGHRFSGAYGITDGGAVLVRPDGFIGWRRLGGTDDAEQELTQALATILCR
jgi:putative polyketide hydroxylase